MRLRKYKPDAVVPSSLGAPAMAFLKGMRPIWYESWSAPVDCELDTRRYWAGKTPIVVQTICEMKRPIKLWMLQGGHY
jgi:hypothetical protein